MYNKKEQETASFSGKLSDKTGCLWRNLDGVWLVESSRFCGCSEDSSSLSSPGHKTYQLFLLHISEKLCDCRGFILKFWSKSDIDYSSFWYKLETDKLNIIPCPAFSALAWLIVKSCRENRPNFNNKICYSNFFRLKSNYTCEENMIQHR